MEADKENLGSVLAPDLEGEEPALASHENSGPEAVIGRQLSEPGRFAYAGLCGVSLGQLFPGAENRCFREQYLQGLVAWLGLDESVMPVMGAFLAGLGFEGSDTFLSILQAEPLLSAGATPITQDLVSFSVKDGQYDARSRVLIRHVSCLLRVSPQHLEEFEESLGERLRERVEESEEESSRRQRKERGRKLRRYLLIGLATVGGGTVIGVTGGLAAPLMAAGAGAVLGAGGAAALGSATGIAIIASLFGAAGAGLTGYKMNKRVGAIEEFEFLPLSSGKHLHLTVAVTGWLCSGKYSSFQAPWCSLGTCGEQYCLVWESRFLRDLGSAMASLLDGLVSMVAQEALKYTILSGIVTALTWPASLLAVASVIDNPWCVCLSRSAEVGKHLAQVLRSRQQGRRPVSLIGFSLGARVIYFCLQELANDQGCEGMVEDVVLLGAPVEGCQKAWERMAKVVAGRIVNGYCRGDWLLGFLYRGSSAQLSVAGLQPIILNNRRITNVDLSSVVKGHLDYMRQMDTILVAVGVPTRETPCASAGPLQPITISDGQVDFLDPSVQKEGMNKEDVESSLVAVEMAGGGEERGMKEKDAMSDGWDIPDISDLLDSLNDTGVEDGAVDREDSPHSHKEVRLQTQIVTPLEREEEEAESDGAGWEESDITPLECEEQEVESDGAGWEESDITPLECEEQEAESDGAGGEGSDNEHTSWTWDSHWTTENTQQHSHAGHKLSDQLSDCSPTSQFPKSHSRGSGRPLHSHQNTISKHTKDSNGKLK